MAQCPSHHSRCVIPASHRVVKHCSAVKSLPSIVWPSIKALHCIQSLHAGSVSYTQRAHRSCTSCHAVQSSAVGIGGGQLLVSPGCCCNSTHAQTFQTLACCCVAVYCQNSASSCLLLYKHVHGQMLDCSASHRHTTAPSMCTRSLGSCCCYKPCFLAALSLAVGDCCAFICCGAVLCCAVVVPSAPLLPRCLVAQEAALSFEPWLTRIAASS